MEHLVLAVFAAVYLGMAFGYVPGLKIDRTGIALTGVVILFAAGAIKVETFGHFVDLPTLLLLFGMMIVSSQFAVAGFYDWVAGRLAAATGSPQRLLLLVVIVSGLLSAVLANDIIAFAIAPVLAAGTSRRGLDPRPFLIALAGACNAGSAMTVIGNPQNILIGQVAHLDFWRFVAVCAPAGLIAMAIVYLLVAWQWRDHLHREASQPSAVAVPEPDRWQAGKAALAAVVLVVLFTTSFPRDLAALVVAAVLLISRRIPSRDMIARVDWGLLLLFACLFTVTGAFSALGLAGQGMDWLGAHGVLPTSVSVMAPLMLLLSNTISNVPAVILILSVWHNPPEGAMYAMALLATLAGNFVIVGSLANIIVSERAAGVGVRLGFRDHARAGIPITILSMIAAMLWLWAIGWMPLR
jgi:Na+/H+ antiporter NhaD/arsenite permease-like protein